MNYHSVTILKTTLPLLLTFFLVACGGGGGGGKSNPSSQAAVIPEGEFVGESTDGKASLALITSKQKTIAYVCNDANIGAWFEAAGGEGQFTNINGDKIFLLADGAIWRATFTSASGTVIPFTTTLAKPDEGLFILSSDGSTTKATTELLTGQILLDGLQVLTARDDPSSQGFRAGWIIGPGEAYHGNLSLKNKSREPAGVPVLFSANIVQEGTTKINAGVVDRLLGGKSLDGVGSVGAVPSDGNPCDNTSFSVSSCCETARFTVSLTTLLNQYTSLGLESETLNTMLDNCAQSLTDMCTGGQLSQCGAAN